MELGLPVTDDLEAVLDAGVDLAVVVAYGRIIPMRILEQVPMVNLHFSLLPRWRGAAPVERALLAGDAVTGVCLMEVAEGLDTGAIYSRCETNIENSDTLQSLRGRLVDLGAGMAVDALAQGLPEPKPQEGEVIHAAKIDPSELEIGWSGDAVAIDRLVRLGGAWTRFRGARLKVWSVRLVGETGSGTPGELDGLRVATGDGQLELIEVQPEGRARQSADAWRNGSRPTPNEQLGQ
jgi:methionyl-tRNA formyltransferase